MVGAKTRASLTSELRRLLPRRGRRGLQKQQSGSMSSYPVHRSLPPTRRCLPTRVLYPMAQELNSKLGGGRTLAQSRRETSYLL